MFTRIKDLFDVGALADAEVLIVGCGSGGSSVALKLAMSGVHKFTLVDPDALGIENVIRHVCGRRYVGHLKVDAVADVLRDRNPEVEVERVASDITNYEAASSLVERAATVVLATDNEASRYFVNQVCVETATAFTVGRVFTRGIGGEVFAYRPGAGGCLACLEAVLQRTKFREGIREVDLVSEDEREKVYAMTISEIKDSPGLAVDIDFITSFHTRFTLDALFSALNYRPTALPPIPENYVVWGNRPVHPFDKHFQLQRINLPAQDQCRVCKVKAA